MLKKSIIIFSFCIILERPARAREAKKIVTLPTGRIRGHFLKTSNNNNYIAFQEIPYATPPTGDLRFKDPVPPKNWNNILDTTRNTKICYQSTPNDLDNEDCLYLNVYAPVDNRLSKLSDLPVMFYIYGGGFFKGDGTFESLGPEFFIDQNIVVVTCNYRLGAFGFLSTQDNVVAGNQALKDQNLALKWVNSNIHLFGGDPLKVTIVGESAGAACIGYHLISKKSRGLFRAAILESGTAICSWAYQRRAKEIAYKLATKFDPNFTTKNSSEELLRLLQSLPAADIRNAIVPDLLTIDIPVGQGYTWAPVIEHKNERSFVTDLMHESIKNGEISRVPVIIGINSEERITLAENLTLLKNQMAEVDKNISMAVNEDFNIKKLDVPAAGKELRSIYTHSLFQTDLGASIRFRSDARYTTAIIRHADLQSKYSEVYFYQFSYYGIMGNKPSIYVQGAERVAHAADLGYLWSTENNANISKFPPADVITHKRLVKLWANFVKYLDPTPVKDDLFQGIRWPKVSWNNFTYLNINETLDIRINPKEYKRWKNVVDTYGNPPFVTY